MIRSIMSKKQFFTGSEIKTMMEDALQDASLKNTLDLDNILLNDGNEVYFQITYDILIKELLIPQEAAFDYCQRLVDYKYIDELHELTIGKFIRWIRKPMLSSYTKYCKPTYEILPNISVGGIINEIVFEDSAVFLRVFQLHNRFTIKIKYDNFLIFQKLH
jgi:hypothetical protein